MKKGGVPKPALDLAAFPVVGVGDQLIGPLGSTFRGFGICCVVWNNYLDVSSCLWKPDRVHIGESQLYNLVSINS